MLCQIGKVSAFALDNSDGVAAHTCSPAPKQPPILVIRESEKSRKILTNPPVQLSQKLVGTIAHQHHRPTNF